jgi:hypothetical protein
MTLFILAILFAAVPSAAPALSHPGTWHGSEVEMRNGEKVLVLVEKSRLQCELEEQRVRVTSVKDEISDEGNARTGKKVSLEHDKGVVQVIARVRELNAGGVETVEVATEDLEKRENPTTLMFHGVLWRIEVIGGDLVVTDGKQRQILATGIDKEGMPSWLLFWAGDMDHDGKLDLLYELHGFNYESSELALSSAAKGKGELMHVVARETHVGC